MPTIDCVIPAFNPSADYLSRAVRSALAVPGLHRCIIVDNGSTRPFDRPEGVLDTRIEIIRQENTGPSGGRNTGIQASQAEMIILLDHDDELLPKGVGAMIGLTEKLGAVACVAARYERGGLGFTTAKEVPPEWANKVLPSPGEVFRPVALFGASGVLITRKLIDAGVRFDPDLRIGEDRDFLRRAADVGPLAVCASSALMVQLHGGNENLSSMANLDRRIADHLKLVERHHRPQDDHHWRESTRWLINAASKNPVTDASWKSLIACAKAHRWPVPIKCTLRRLFKKPA